MATVSLLRGLWIPHRTRAQGLVRRATPRWDASRGEAPAATWDDGLRARNALGGSARRQRQLDSIWIRLHQ